MRKGGRGGQQKTDETWQGGISQKMTKSIFYLIRNCCYVVRNLTWGRGGVSQKLTNPDKGGRGGRKKANFNWRHLWTIPYKLQKEPSVCPCAATWMVRRRGGHLSLCSVTTTLQILTNDSGRNCGKYIQFLLWRTFFHRLFFYLANIAQNSVLKVVVLAWLEKQLV